MGIVSTARENPLWTSLAAGAVTLTSIIGGFNALGIDPIPWVSAGDLERVEKKVDERDAEILKLIKDLQTDQKAMSKDQRELLKDFWQKRLDEANEELRQNPSSRTAKKQKQEAEAALEKIDRQEAGSPHP